jgi:hypothetical protein
MLAKRAAMLVLATTGLLLSSSAARDQKELSFEDRVKAQEAIERVYYSHQLEATQPFEQAVPRGLLEAKVTRYLKQSAALEQLWKTPVTAETLRREWERIAASSRFPDRLSEVYAVLGNDPVLIQECFVRPALVERLARSFFLGDRVLQATPRNKAEQLADALRLSRTPNPDVPHAEIELRVAKTAPGASEPLEREKGIDRENSLDANPLVREITAEDLQAWQGKLSNRRGQVSVEERLDSYAVRVLTEAGVDGLRFEQYEIEKMPWEPWWMDHQERFDPLTVHAVARGHAAAMHASLPGNSGPSTSFPVPESGPCIAGDTWDNATLAGIPEARVGLSAVWTGSLMLVWGGTQFGALGTGERYDPLTDSWTPMSAAGLSNRAGHRAVWTGTEMVVWGGRTSSGALLSDGARYNPGTDIWSTMSSFSGLSGRTGHTAVWTGTEMIVFGGSQPPTGSRYNPATDTWTPTLTPGWSAKFNHSAVWTGARMLVWGGNEGSAATATGGAYNPSDNTWSSITASGAPPGAQSHTAVWTGSSMVVWGGEVDDSSTTLASGGIYDPGADSWTSTATAGAPSARAMHTAVWTGTEMIVWGGRSLNVSPEQRYNTGGRFNPVANSWTPTNSSGAPAPIASPAAVWTGDRMIVWGNRSGGRYDPVNDLWTPVKLGDVVRPLTLPTSVWTGNLMIVWGGLTEINTASNFGARYDPVLDLWTPVTVTLAPNPRQDHVAVWTGTTMVVWGGRNGNTLLASGGRYDPTADSWASTSATGAPSARYFASAVWTGSRVIVWGGWTFIGGSTAIGTGNLYDPVWDTWSPPTSITGAPSPRGRHTAVWTGSRMIVWGGQVAGQFNSAGGQYDPVTGQWKSVTTVSAPNGRFAHAALWTGDRMIIWGGWRNGLLSSGGQYDPIADSWSAIPTLGAPSPTVYFSFVWTGSEMIVWGGGTSITFPVSNPSGTGARYHPASGAWTATNPAQAPTPRAGHAAVWTGTRMIVWGANVDAGQYVPYALDSNDADGDGMTACGGDCNDNDPTIHPGAAESCDGLDNDCDGARDEGGYLDLDQDGYPGCGGDCNDNNPAIHPNEPEACNDIDDDCDASVDEGFADADGDGYVTCLDCNDANPAVNPAATEVCNGIDDDCDHVVDDGGIDNDGDTFTLCEGDCNDSASTVHPGAVETCDGLDNDCNSVVDDRDADSDGYRGCGGPDCNDGNPAIHPGAQETCNGVDDNCNLAIDDLDLDGDGFSACGPDCNDADPGAWGLPLEVTGFQPNGSSQVDWVWDPQASFTGPSVLYDIASGPITPNKAELSSGACLTTVALPEFTDAQPDPALGWGHWYLVLAKNSCLVGSYGTDYLGSDRPVPPCP